VVIENGYDIMMRVLALIMCMVTMANAAVLTTQQDGEWQQAATWAGGVIPGTNDQARIAHYITILISADVGQSPGALDNLPGPYPARDPALEILEGGSLILQTNAALVCRGDLQCRDLLSMEPGATITFNAEHSTTNNSFYWLMLLDNTEALLRMRGTADNRCTVTSIPINRAGIAATKRYLKLSDDKRLIAVPGSSGGGAIDAEYAHLLGLGSDTFYAWHLSPTSHTRPVRMIDGLIEQCGRIGSIAYTDKGSGTADFVRTRWIDSVRPLSTVVGSSYWGLFETGADSGSTCRVVECDFDMRVWLRHPNGYTVEDCVFRYGLLSRQTDTQYHGVYTSFRRNLLSWPAELSNNGLALAYGDAIEDCILIHDYTTHNNPHYVGLGGKSGTALIKGCLFWFTGPNLEFFGPEGDGPMTGSADSGTQVDNKFIIERCIFMPNRLGPEADKNISCNVTSGIFGTTNSQVIVRRNTAFTQGVSIGETVTTVSGALVYIKSNIFYGPPAGNGRKINDYGHGEDDVVVATNADYNAGFRMQDGDYYVPGVSGKGYCDLSLVESQAIGAHDIDDVDPMFVDATRTPLTWSISLGGDGNMGDAMDLLKPTGSHSMEELIDYIREGFRPQNEALRGAGDPAVGAPDMGAVDFLGEISNGVIITNNPTADAQISWEWGGKANSNYGSLIRSNIRGGDYGYRALIKFPLTGIDAQVNDAKLVLVNDWDPGATPQTFMVYRLTKDWVETQVTYNNAATADAWASQGADFSLASEAVSTGITWAGGGGYDSFELTNLTSIVQYWIDNPAENYGLIVLHDGGGASEPSPFPVTWTREQTTVSYRPKLVVDSEALAGDPVCTITTPTVDATYSTSSGTVNLAGTASDPDGTITSVIWTNAATGGNGTCSGTTTWSQDGIVLNPGANTITVTATDNSSSIIDAVITVSTLFGQTFDLDGITFESTPTIISQATVAAMASPGQDISTAELRDVYFRTATGQFILGMYSGSYNEVVFFDPPATGAGFTVNSGGSLIDAETSDSLSEGPGDTVLTGKPTDQCWLMTNVFSVNFTADFTASASTRVNEKERRKLDIDTSLLFASTDGSAFGGNYDDGGISVFKLSDSNPGTAPLFDTATRGTSVVIDGADATYNNNLPPGLAITPAGNIVYGNGNGKPSVNVIVYSYSGLDPASGDYGSENGVLAVMEAIADFNVHVGLSGADKLGSLSAIAYGQNLDGRGVLSIVDQNGTASDYLDDRVFFFVQQDTPPQGTLIYIK